MVSRRVEKTLGRMDRWILDRWILDRLVTTENWILGQEVMNRPTMENWKSGQLVMNKSTKVSKPVEKRLADQSRSAPSKQTKGN